MHKSREEGGGEEKGGEERGGEEQGGKERRREYVCIDGTGETKVRGNTQ